jgi:hypothetical protein
MDDLFVILIVAFDQLGDQQRLVEVKCDLPAAHAHFHVAVVKQARKFRDRWG